MQLTLDHPQDTLGLDSADIVDKTASGRDELRTRAAGLPQRARSVLIMVDGVRSVGQLQEAVARLNAPADTIESLLAQGLIVRTVSAVMQDTFPPTALQDIEVSIVPAETTDLERFRVAKKFMNDTVVDAIGLRSFMFTLKLEKCATLGDLGQLAPEYARLLVKAKGHEVALALRTRLRELLT
jgi:hypothetical protein